MARRTRQALVAALGGTGVGTAASVVLVVATLGWFGDTLLQVLPQSWRFYVGLFAFPLLASVLIVAARHGRVPDYRFQQDEELTKKRALIVFLSPPGGEAIRSVSEAGSVFSPGDDIRTVQVREKFEHSPWRMCAEALAYHADKLEHVIAFGSADSVGDDGALLDPGTCRYADRFISTFRSLYPRDDAPNFEVLPSSGVDYENASDLGQALESAVHRLKELGVRERDMIVDVTGGSKVWSAVAGIIALGDSRAFQYVSRRDYVVHVYDIRLEMGD
jgi:hypothetical protein